MSDCFYKTQDNYQQERQFEKFCGVIRWKSLSKFLFVLLLVTSVGLAVTYLHMDKKLTQARTHGHGELVSRANSQTAGTAEQQIQIIANTLDKRIKETSPCLPPSCTQCATRITAAPSDGYNRESRQCPTNSTNSPVVNLTCYNCNGKCASVSREEVRSRMDFIHIPIQCPATNIPALMSCCDVVQLCQLHDLCHGGDCVCGAGNSNVSCSCPADRTGKYCNETAEQPKVPCKCFHSTLLFCSDDMPACDTVSHGHPDHSACQMMVNATSRCVCNTTRQLDDSSGLGSCSSMQMSTSEQLTSGTGICKPSVSLTVGLTCMYLMVLWLTHGLRTDIWARAYKHF